MKSEKFKEIEKRLGDSDGFSHFAITMEVLGIPEEDWRSYMKGGSQVKWGLVEQGLTAEEADNIANALQETSDNINVIDKLKELIKIYDDGVKTDSHEKIEFAMTQMMKLGLKITP